MHLLWWSYHRMWSIKTNSKQRRYGKQDIQQKREKKRNLQDDNYVPDIEQMCLHWSSITQGTDTLRAVITKIPAIILLSFLFFVFLFFYLKTVYLAISCIPVLFSVVMRFPVLPSMSCCLDRPRCSFILWCFELLLRAGGRSYDFRSRKYRVFNSLWY